MNETTRKYLEESYELHCTDYRDSIDAVTMAECLKNKDASSIYSAFDNDDFILNEELCRVESLMTRDGHGDIYTEDEEEIRDWIGEHDTSDPVRDLCRRSSYRARVVQRSNSECWAPPYAAGSISYDGAFREAVDMLSLNPKEVKKALLKWADCTGRWPDRPGRRPVVDAEDFSRCCRETPNFSAWGFFGTVSGSFLLDNDFRTYPKNVIPKDTACCWCNWWDGGGSLETIHTIRDISLQELNTNIAKADKHSDVIFELDEKGACRGYSIMPEVYDTTYENPLLKSASPV